MALLKKHQPHLVTNRCFPCLIAAWRQGIPLLSIHPSRPGTVAQQIRALVSVGLGQRHKSCHVTASRWWPKGTWPDLTAWGIFLRSGWYKQTNNGLKNHEKSATYNLWDDNVTNLHDGRMPPTKWDDDVTKPRWENCHMFHAILGIK